MSEVFYGVMVPTHDSTTESTLRSLVMADVSLHTVNSDCVAMTQATGRSPNRAALEGLAANLSARFESALLVEYDTRVGHRASALFRSGAKLSEFGARDEIYVPVDDDGMPETSGSRLQVDELDPNEEYETVANAVQLGLAAFNRCRWEEFKAMLASP